ncbi:MAG: type I-C CRISPR-associated protein Cas5c [Janthinobacterium lividum]
MDYPPVEVKVWGPYACLTRPEAHVERVSYEVLTPSAARGILESIFWHKPMRWRVREIVVLKKIRHFSILRNEVKSKAGRGGEISIADDRTQRHTLGLKEVEYIIRADAWLPPDATDRDGQPVDVAKYRDQFRRRVQNGQCFQRPYLGCREFAADFGPPDGTEIPHGSLVGEIDLGRMLFDIDYDAGGNQAKYFEARLENGVLHIPPVLYENEGAT